MKKKIVCPIHNIELICPACVGATGGKIGGKARTVAKQQSSQQNVLKAQAAHHKKAQSFDLSVANIHSKVWSRQDAAVYFIKHPHDEVSAKDLIKAAPTSKKASAHKNATSYLLRLLQHGHIIKLRRGVYRLASKSKSN
jgi:hypothetical protein